MKWSKDGGVATSSVVFTAANRAMEYCNLNSCSKSNFGTLRAVSGLEVSVIPLQSAREANGMSGFVVTADAAKTLTSVGLYNNRLGSTSRLMPQHFQLISSSELENIAVSDALVGGSIGSSIGEDIDPPISESLGALLYRFGFLVSFDEGELIYLDDIVTSASDCDSGEYHQSGTLMGHSYIFCYRISEALMKDVQLLVNATLPIMIFGNSGVDELGYSLRFKKLPPYVDSDIYTGDANGPIAQEDQVFRRGIVDVVKARLNGLAFPSEELYEMFYGFLQPDAASNTKEGMRYVGGSGVIGSNSSAVGGYSSSPVADGNISLDIYRSVGWGINAVATP